MARAGRRLHARTSAWVPTVRDELRPNVPGHASAATLGGKLPPPALIPRAASMAPEPSGARALSSARDVSRLAATGKL
jgi:hypothetical protein